MTLEHHRLNSHQLDHARATTWIRCFAAVLIGLLITTGNARAAGLWVANENSNTIAEFQGKLTKAHAVLKDNGLDGPDTVAFDGGGNLWVTNFNGNTIFEYTQSQIKKIKKHLTAAVIISEDTDSNLSSPEGLVFDSSGNMWVGTVKAAVILEYTPEQFAASGSPTPNVILNAATFQFSSPSHLSFDSAGNLWVLDEGISNSNGGSGEVSRYDKAQIDALTAGAHNIDPVFGIGFNGFQHLETIAFDGGGNLWLADELGSKIYEFSSGQLSGVGLDQDLAPAVVLSATAEHGACNLSLDHPYGLAFDGGGNLFVANAAVVGGCQGSLARFPAASIGSTGSPSPKGFTRSGLKRPNALTFGPTVR